VELKLGKFTHADAGQMNLYVNYACEHWTNAEENPPIGLILCSEHDAAVAHYALGNLDNKVLARECGGDLRYLDFGAGPRRKTTHSEAVESKLGDESAD
jgi:hypothetical protein